MKHSIMGDVFLEVAKENEKNEIIDCSWEYDGEKLDSKKLKMIIEIKD